MYCVDQSHCPRRYTIPFTHSLPHTYRTDVATLLSICLANDALLKKTLKDIESLQEDITIVNSIVKQAATLSTPHQVSHFSLSLSFHLFTSHFNGLRLCLSLCQTLDDSLKELLGQLNKQLYEKQNNDSQLLTLEITITSQ